MRPLGPLKEIQLVFENFQMTSQTVTTPEVQVTKYVRFKEGCGEEALETVDGYKVWYDLHDEQFHYFFIRQVVPGPLTDGNGIHVVDDCEIKIVTKLEPYIEGQTNRIQIVDAKKEKPQSAQMAELQTPLEPVQIKAGCHSGAPNGLLPIILLVLMLQKTVNLFKKQEEK